VENLLLSFGRGHFFSTELSTYPERNKIEIRFITSALTKGIGKAIKFLRCLFYYFGSALRERGTIEIERYELRYYEYTNGHSFILCAVRENELAGTPNYEKFIHNLSIEGVIVDS